MIPTSIWTPRCRPRKACERPSATSGRPTSDPDRRALFYLEALPRLDLLDRLGHPSLHLRVAQLGVLVADHLLQRPGKLVRVDALSPRILKRPLRPARASPL